MTFFSKNPAFDKLIEKATSHLLLEPDWSANLTACDMIRQGEVTGKYAVGAIKKKLSNSNPHVVIYAMNLIESMAKNCGSTIHEEIATQDFMNQMKSLIKEKDPVRSKSLELIQVWAHAFRHQSKYGIIQSTYNTLKTQGCIFPTLIESDAMFVSETAPEWQDADCCYRCKIAFSALKRKHHCRNCGNIFCDECTTKRSNIPKYGIEKEVRVCESCYESLKGSDIHTGRITNQKGGHVQFNEDVIVRNFTPDTKETPSEASRAQKERELELQEKEELELALALSASEAESQENKKNKSSLKPISQPTPSNQTGFNGIYSALDTSEMDPELARYLNRNYWENKASDVSTNVKTTQPSAPVMPNSPTCIIQSNHEPINPSKNNVVLAKNGKDLIKLMEVSSEQEEFLSALKSSIEIFVNRMHSNSQRGRSIANDSAVQTLFLTLNAMHPQLLQYINEQDDQRNYFEALQDKLAQLRDAREALDALREEHREKKRREEEEAAKLRQIQMMQKLEIMRQKKQEFLDYQRQLAVDRMQQQEREMAMRLAQQKQIMQMRQYQQQFPYSIQQQQQTMPNADTSNINQQLPPNISQFVPQNLQGMNIGSYGYAMPGQYGIPNTEFFNMQGMSQNLPPVRMSEGQINQMNYVEGVIPNNPNMVPQVTQNMYTVPSQHLSNWEAQSSNNPPHNNQPVTDSQTTHDQKESQLISFD